MMRGVCDKRLVATVHTMEDEWLDIVDSTGDLTLDDMRKSLQRARYRGEDVMIPKHGTEGSLLRMNHYLIGDLVFEHGILQ